jgi:hypothetical protein
LEGLVLLEDGSPAAEGFVTINSWSNMLTTIIILVAIGALGYVLRRNFRRAWYVLRTGDENPEWEKLGGDYFVAPWEKRRRTKSAVNGEEKAPNVSELRWIQTHPFLT